MTSRHPASVPDGHPIVGVGDRLEIDDLRPAHGGVVVGRHDGRAVFVRGALPGERVLVEVTDARRASFCHARVLEVIEASSHRVEPMCPAAAAGAGCCDLSFTDDGFARSLKATVIGELLHRIGGFGIDEFAVPVQSLGAPTGWRTRIRLSVDDHGVPGTRVMSSDAVVTGVDCAQSVAGLLDGVGDRGYTPGADLVAVLDADDHRHLIEVGPVTNTRARPGRGRRGGNSRVADRGRAQRSRVTRARGAETVVSGGPVAVHRVGSRRWELPVTAFWQAHRDAPSRYGDVIASMALRHTPSATIAWDLYGGVGVFAGALCDRVPTLRSLTVVEADRAAIAAAAQTFADDDRVRTVRAPVADAVRSLEAPDVVVVDPPRAGAGRAVVAAICAADPALVVHVGCDAATFARDLGTYREHGYRPVEIEALDAFPMTHHVETIAALVPVR